MKLLPYPQMPLLICYHNKAFPIGIIQANSPENVKNGCARNLLTLYIILILRKINLI